MNNWSQMWLYGIREDDNDSFFLTLDDLQHAIKMADKNELSVHAYIRQAIHDENLMRDDPDWLSFSKDEYNTNLQIAKEKGASINDLLKLGIDEYLELRKRKFTINEVAANRSVPYVFYRVLAEGKKTA